MPDQRKDQGASIDTTDKLIGDFYLAAAREDWRAFREHALERLVRHFEAGSAAWLSRGRDVSSGELTQYPHAFLDPEALDEYRKPAKRDFGVVEARVAGSAGIVFVHEHRDGGPISTIYLGYPRGVSLSRAAELARVAAHMIEASAFALNMYIGRDDWLSRLGRTSRGSAAFVDAVGTIYAISPLFIDLLEESGMVVSKNRLPFELPEEVLGPSGGEFVRGTLHVRVARQGNLYMLHARQPLPLDSLSPREQEIARALGDGKTLKSIARHYGIAVSTVANHTTRIYRKLAIYRREDLVELVRAKPPKSKGRT